MLLDFFRQDISVIAPQECVDALGSGVVTHVTNGDQIITDEEKLGKLYIQVIDTPCHTSGHVNYLINKKRFPSSTGNNDIGDDGVNDGFYDPNHAPILFSGDTLFVGGVGRFFEGTAKDMFNALSKLRNEVPHNANVYCGHEYTMSNLDFSLSLTENNPFGEKENETEVTNYYRDWCKKGVVPKILACQTALKKTGSTVPSVFGEETLYNPFLHVFDMKNTSMSDNADDDMEETIIERLGKIRNAKDSFRARSVEEMTKVIENI
eukprot:g4184.t1